MSEGLQKNAIFNKILINSLKANKIELNNVDLLKYISNLEEKLQQDYEFMKNHSHTQSNILKETLENKISDLQSQINKLKNSK